MTVFCGSSPCSGDEARQRRYVSNRTLPRGMVRSGKGERLRVTLRVRVLHQSLCHVVEQPSSGK